MKRVRCSLLIVPSSSAASRISSSCFSDTILAQSGQADERSVCCAKQPTQNVCEQFSSVTVLLLPSRPRTCKQIAHSAGSHGSHIITNVPEDPAGRALCEPSGKLHESASSFTVSFTLNLTGLELELV